MVVFGVILTLVLGVAALVVLHRLIKTRGCLIVLALFVVLIAVGIISSHIRKVNYTWILQHADHEDLALLSSDVESLWQGYAQRDGGRAGAKLVVRPDDCTQGPCDLYFWYEYYQGNGNLIVSIRSSTADHRHLKKARDRIDQWFELQHPARSIRRSSTSAWQNNLNFIRSEFP